MVTRQMTLHDIQIEICTNRVLSHGSSVGNIKERMKRQITSSLEHIMTMRLYVTKSTY